MKILVTGTAGFIGFHLAKKLLSRNDEVVGLDNINEYYDIRIKYARLSDCGIDKECIEENKLIQSLKYKKYRFVKLNLEDKNNLEELFKREKFDAVCNLAAQAGVRYSLNNPQTYIDSNITGFMNILECCRNYNVKNLSYASSSSVYGLNETLPFSTNHNAEQPISLYAATKKSNELMAHTYSHLFGIQTTGLRFFTVYGPWGRPDMALYLFVKAAIENKAIDVYNNGEMIRDFTYIDDVIQALIKVIDNPARQSLDCDKKKVGSSLSKIPYKVYNIGNNNPIKLMNFIGVIEKKLGRKITKNMLKIQAGDVLSTYADIKCLTSNMNYKPNTSVEEGVKKFIDWYVGFFNIKLEKNNKM